MPAQRRGPGTPSDGPGDEAARAQTRVAALAGTVLVVALVVAVGWYARVDAMVAVVPGSVPMRMLTAVCLAGLAGAHLAVRHPAWRRGLLVLGVVVSLTVLSEYALGVSYGIDELLVEDWATPEPRYAGRPAAATMASVALLAVGLWLADQGRSRAAEVVTAVPLLVGVVAGYGWLYGGEALYTVGQSPMPSHTAACIVMLALANGFAVEGGILRWVAFGDDPGARLQRALLPVAFVGFPLVGYFVLRGHEEGLYDDGLGHALLITTIAATVALIGLRAGRQAQRLHRGREELLAEVSRARALLEDRVRERSQQLQEHRTKVALYEERDRIARDLHDRVIQRIFASGLQLSSLSRVATREAERLGNAESKVPPGIETVAVELDLAIRELRNSIFQLTSIGDTGDVGQVVQDIAARASRILGFTPRVHVAGDLLRPDHDTVIQLASVVQEGLSNVARHARASRAEVRVEVGDDEVVATITDDGIGLPDPLPRSSGISNLAERARELGGSADWRRGEPSGTVLTWRVPLQEAPPDQANVTPVAASDTAQSRLASAGS